MRGSVSHRRRVLAWLLLLTVTITGSAAAADAAAPAIPPFLQAAKPMSVRIVRNSDPHCASERCTDWIAADGPIGPGSAARFASVMRALGRRHLPVLINSPGGLVNEAMAIGRLIRAKQLDVAVTRTILAACPSDREACGTLTPDGVVKGLPDSRRALCASACPLILAGGSRRYVAPWAHVGVHQYVDFIRQTKVLRVFRILTRVVNGVRVEVSRTLVAEKPLPGSTVLVRGRAHYDTTEAYFARMGVGAGLMPLLRSTPSSGIDWLTPDELVSTRLATELSGGEDLVAPVDAPATPAVATGPSRTAPNASEAGRAAAAPEIAAYIDDAGTRVNLVPGHVTWSVDRAGEIGDADARALVADVALDGDAGDLTFRIVRNGGASGRPMMHLFARLLRGGNSPFGHIVALETPGLRKDAHALPDAFLGHVEASPPAVISMVLSDTAQDERRDMALLASDQWIDVPVMIDQDRTVRITFALGLSGRRAVGQWQASPASRAQR